ncbi:MAG: hypothetical protein ACRDPK_13560, partial [Carbonactinosporaceae bacterium]
LLVPLVRAGEIVGREDLAAARERHAVSRAELPAAALRLSRGGAAIPTLYESGHERELELDNEFEEEEGR